MHRRKVLLIVNSLCVCVRARARVFMCESFKLKTRTADCLVVCMGVLEALTCPISTIEQ
jgi:hypothetical protein